ncbi:FAD:protein FMN transferase [Piscinibacter terrae]|uniref:FAD:protein FMN transferase n=1 Tax=Piscinibacter terrae TaxID=2496871 RepID=A0A3N7JZ77_9BURK|nr:FAD:protein FMN transferase [Albitalea terrae]RQP26089.1 FAD:protein FMN transferase [Albitalea terrae]
MRRVLVPARLSHRDPPFGGEVHALEGRSMGTTWSVKVVLPDPAMLAGVRAGIDDGLALVVRQMSTWEPDSDLSRFNHAAPGSWCRLPGECFHVLQQALQTARDSGGAYDPTTGTLVNLWGFGPTGRHGETGFRIPTASKLEEARRHTGWQRITLDPVSQRAFQPGGICLDLSAIAKGYAVDHVSRSLLLRGLADHLVEIGGELMGSGLKPDGQPWWVSLEQPLSHVAGAPGLPDNLVALHGLAVATSGDYRRFFTHEGSAHPHTIDPRTGRPITHGLASVCVLHAQCMLADAQSTALSVMGLDEGLAWANQHGVAALFVQRVNSGFEERMSNAFAALL